MRGDDARIAEALSESFLADIPMATRHRLLERSRLVLIPRGGAGPPSQAGPRGAGIVVSGVLRIYLLSEGGREVTIRYVRRGGEFGIPSVFRVNRTFPIQVAALVDSEVLVLDVPTLVDLAQHDAGVAWALAEVTSLRLQHMVGEIAGNSFLTVRQRIARHLLDIARAVDHADGHLVAPIDQQDLADAIGSVGDVVGRVLGDLRREGIVETRRGAISLLDAERLSAEL